MAARKRVYVPRWRLVYCSTSRYSHAAREGGTRTLCGAMVGMEGGRLMGSVTIADIDCKSCRKIIGLMQNAQFRKR